MFTFNDLLQLFDLQKSYDIKLFIIYIFIMKLKNKTNDFLFFHGLKSFKPNEIREVEDLQIVERLLRCPNIEKVIVEKKPTETKQEPTETKITKKSK